MCGNCKVKPIYANKRCYACWKYHKRTSKERPKKLWFKLLGRHEKNRPRWCKNCGSTKVVSNRRCNPCRIYLERHKRERPKHLRDSEHRCKNCSIPLVSKARSGYCYPCRKYSYRGKERPRHLWGIGEFGWCECGKPATVQDKEFGGLCRECSDIGVSAYSKI